VERDFERVKLNACSTFLLRNVEDLGWRSRCSDQATDWTIRGLILDRGKRFYCCPRRQYRLCGPPIFLFNGCRGLFHRRKIGTGREVWPFSSISCLGSGTQLACLNCTVAVCLYGTHRNFAVYYIMPCQREASTGCYVLIFPAVYLIFWIRVKKHLLLLFCWPCISV
jgi:hypothetical protein